MTVKIDRMKFTDVHFASSYGIIIEHEDIKTYSNMFKSEDDFDIFVESFESIEEALIEMIRQGCVLYEGKILDDIEDSINGFDYILDGEQAKLPTQQECTRISECILESANVHFEDTLGVKKIETFFEHGQWWVNVFLEPEFDHENQVFKTYSVNDREKNVSDYANDLDFGFDFEEM